MTMLAAIVGLGIAGMGVALVIAPDWLLSLGNWRSRAMMWSAIASRILLGVVFVRAAPDTGAPLLFQVLGGIFVAAGVAAALLGVIAVGLFFFFRRTGASPMTRIPPEQ